MNKRINRLREITKILLSHGFQKDRSPANIRAAIEELGPTYIKLAQILSTREDLIPKEYCDEFAGLKENASPLAFSVVLDVIKEQLSCDPSAVFAEITEKPLGSASIGQVHRAKLLDGTDVVIKVMRPGIAEKVTQDFEMLKKAVKYCNLVSDSEMLQNLYTIFDETFESMKLEMNFNQELENIELFTSKHSDTRYIKFPKTFKEYTTSQMLVMEYINGIKIDDVARLTKEGYDVKEICAKLVENYIVQVIDHGVFHADPHSGNVMVQDGKIVWLDLGMIGVINRTDRILYKRIIKAMLKSDAYELKNVILTMGMCRYEINHAKLYQDVENMMFKIGNIDINDIDMSELFEEVMDIARRHGIVLPKSVTMLARSVVIIQNIIARLNPQSNLLQFLRSHVIDIYKEEFDAKKQMTSTAQKLFKNVGKITDASSGLMDLLDITIKGQRHTNIEIVNLRENVDRVNRMTNKLILGIILTGVILVFGALLGVLVYTVNAEWMTLLAVITLISLFLSIGTMSVALFIAMLRDKKK